jgi:alanyl-tRNA synthetase
LFEQYATAAREIGLKELNGKDVWRLYDTYGFPVDLTLLMAGELGLGVNKKEFEEAQAASKEASKASLKIGAKDVVKLDVHDIAALEDMSVPKTDDSAKFGKSLAPKYYLVCNTVRRYGNIDAIIKAIYHKKAFVPVNIKHFIGYSFWNHPRPNEFLCRGWRTRIRYRQHRDRWRRGL